MVTLRSSIRDASVRVAMNDAFGVSSPHWRETNAYDLEKVTAEFGEEAALYWQMIRYAKTWFYQAAMNLNSSGDPS